MLADGSVRSYFALPPDYPLEPLGVRPPLLHEGPMGGRGPLGPERGPGFGFEREFPPRHPPGGRFSPDGFREPPFGLGSGDFRGLDGPRGPLEGPSSLKRKFGEEDEFARHRQHVLEYGNMDPNVNPNGPPRDRLDYLGRPGSPLRRDSLVDGPLSKHQRLLGDGYTDRPPSRGGIDRGLPAAVSDVDPQVLKRAFLRFSKELNENVSKRNNYLDDGKQGRMSCLACGRSSKDFSTVHELIMHTYSSEGDSRPDHLGLHKALCVLMGFSHTIAPDNSKAYQLLPIEDAVTNREDLIVWPPTVIVHNTLAVVGKRKHGRVEGMGNKEMDSKIKELGFPGGKAKSLYGKDGHLGVTLVKFASSEAGVKEAEGLAEHFEKENHGRRGWARALASQQPGADDELNPAMVMTDEKTGDRKRILYGYLATATDIDKFDFDSRKKAVIKSKRDLDVSEQ